MVPCAACACPGVGADDMRALEGTSRVIASSARVNSCTGSVTRSVRCLQSVRQYQDLRDRLRWQACKSPAFICRMSCSAIERINSEKHPWRRDCARTTEVCRAALRKARSPGARGAGPAAPVFRLMSREVARRSRNFSCSTYEGRGAARRLPAHFSKRFQLLGHSPTDLRLPCRARPG